MLDVTCDKGKVTIAYDEAGGKLLCELFQGALEARWAKEREVKTLDTGGKVFIPHALACRGIVIH